MGILKVGAIHNWLALPDDTLAVVHDAVREAFEFLGFVTICAWDPESDGYLAVDASGFLPGRTAEGVPDAAEDRYALGLAAIFDSDPAPVADRVLVDELVEVIEESGGFVVLDADDELVLDLSEIREIKASARRINPFG